MMNDELRVMYELNTFTSDDIAECLEMSRSGANYLLERAVGMRLVHRIRVGKAFLYALTARGKAIVEKLPPIDTEEMCLPLSFEGVNAICPACGSFELVTDVWNEERGYGALYQNWSTACARCGCAVDGGTIDLQD